MKHTKIVILVISFLVVGMCLQSPLIWNQDGEHYHLDSLIKSRPQGSEDPVVLFNMSSNRVNSLDPHFSIEEPASSVMNQVLERLFYYDLGEPNFPLVGELAEGYYWKSPLEVEIYLREGVQFHDGTSFNASSAIWNWHRINELSQTNGGYYYSLYLVSMERYYDVPGLDFSWHPEYGEPDALIEIVNNVVEVNPYTIKFELNVPFNPFIHLLAGPFGAMISPSSHSQTELIDFPSNPSLVGTGPFKYMNYDEGEMVTYLERNNNYWRPSANITHIEIHEFDDDNIGVERMLDGELDYTSRLAGRHDELESNINVDLIGSNYSQTLFYFTLNCETLPQPIRKTLNYIVESADLISNMDQIGLEPQAYYIPEHMYYSNTSIDTPSYDLNIARQIMIEEGYISAVEVSGWEDADWIARTNTAPLLELSHLMIPWGTQPVVGEYLQNQAALIGINFTLEIVYDYGEWLDRLGNDPLSYHTAFVGWGLDYPDMSNYLIPCYSSTGFSNLAHLNDPLLDEYLYNATMATDYFEISNLYSLAQNRLLNELYPSINTLMRYNYGALNSEWTGLLEPYGYHLKLYFVRLASSEWIPEAPDNVYIKLDTEIGKEVEIIDSTSMISLTFDTVSTEGTTTIKISQEEPEIDSYFEVIGEIYDISTEASFTGLIEISVPIPESYLPGHSNPQDLRIMHYDGVEWTDITTYVNETEHLIYGETSSFSIFAVMMKTIPSISELVNQLHVMVEMEPENSWNKLSNQLTMIKKIAKLQDLAESGKLGSAYSKLIHDIKPKLTGLKEDEHGNPWGNGVLKNPWIITNHEIYCTLINEIASFLNT